MKRDEHIVAARTFMAAEAPLRERGQYRLAGEALWGASCEAINALSHMDGDEDHEGRTRITDRKLIIAARVRQGLLRDTDNLIYQYHVIPLHTHFYNANLSDDDLFAHMDACRELTTRMLAVT